jgi:4a-hydroxytetrahydrobiopterin dehydratase
MVKEEVERQLRQVSGLMLVGNAIEKNYRFANFRQAIEFINRVADVAEALRHHPDVLLWNWNNVKLTITAHTIEGLSKDDFTLASKVDQITLIY